MSQFTYTIRPRAIANWLYAVAALIVLMVAVGGITRLTESGLSITEWKLVTGILPPLSETAWLAEFEKYKQIPQYEHVNRGMSLAAFKLIYWWEWTHRFLGRLIGVAFLVPFVWFLARGQIRRPLMWRLAGIFALGGLQGFMGWYMVSSGLADRIHQPRRAHLYPRSWELVQSARDLGALGATISGAGPTVLVWCDFESSGAVAARLREFVADGWAEVHRVPFTATGAEVRLLL